MNLAGGAVVGVNQLAEADAELLPQLGDVLTKGVFGKHNKGGNKVSHLAVSRFVRGNGGNIPD